MNARLAAAPLLLLLFFSAPARADTLDVPGDFATIQAAIVAAQNGDVILVQPGNYLEALDTLGKSITLTGAGGSAVTIINATGHDNSAIYALGGSVVIEGFTITGGSGHKTGPLQGRAGGGIYMVTPGAGLVRNCRIAGNGAFGVLFPGDGGGAYVQGLVTFSDCDFESNFAGLFGGGLYGGVAIDCRFTDNFAAYGGGYYNIGNSDSPRRCTFETNHATEFAGGCYVANVSALSRVSNCTFVGNSAELGASAAVVIGGSAASQGGIVENCVFADNVGGDGIALQFWQDSPLSLEVVVGSTFLGERVDGRQFINCILRDGATPSLASASLLACDIEGGWGGSGSGNFDADPLFAAPATHDYHLLPGSPCFNRGAVSGFVQGIDLDGQPRTQAGATDVGADELIEDCNANGSPDYADLQSGTSMDANENGVPDECEGTWTDLGHALAGSNGVPQLLGLGSLLPVHPVTLILDQAKQSGTSTLIFGASILNLSFKGGVLVPSAGSVLPGLPLSSSGSLSVSGLWPAGIPSGFSVIFQHWVLDDAGPQGFAASNGLAGTTP